MAADVRAEFWKIFARVLGYSGGQERVAQREIEEWDSLRHVELVFELEERFDLDISPDDVVELFSDTDTVLEYLRAQVEQS